MKMNKTGYRGTILAISLSILWIVITSIIGTLGLYETPRNVSHLAIVISVLTPSVFYIALYILLPGIREWTKTLDLAMLTLPHAWRTIGYTFLTLWAFGILPAEFSAPAGFGDFVIGLAAPFIAVALWLKWNGAIRATLWFHLLGIVDFFFAILTGTMAYGVAMEQMNQIDPMTTFPLVIIPTAFVPLLLLSHVMVLLKITLAQNSTQYRVAMTNV
jgi:hypothetical protein